MANDQNTIFLVGTADTKGEELHFLKSLISQNFDQVVLVDVGTRNSSFEADVSAHSVASFHPDGVDAVLGTDDRGAAVEAMGLAFSRYISDKKNVAAIIGIGGGGGTSIICAGMRELALGIPKLMVSTLASSDVSPYVGVSDIMMMPSITDMAGLNAISRTVLHNAAQAISGMVSRPSPAYASPAYESKPSIGLTMFGVTTDCVMAINKQLRDEFDCLVFHATGTGGRTMEKLADSGMLSGIIDISTTEVCDHLFDGVLSAGEDRLGAIARTKLPYVGSVGALDMINFWAPDTLPKGSESRTIYKHNPNVTLMRTTEDECRIIGQWVGEKLNRCEGPVRFLIPEKGISALDIEGGAFYDPEADLALFEAIEATVQTTDNRRIIRLPYHVNDPQFAAEAVVIFRAIMK